MTAIQKAKRAYRIAAHGDKLRRLRDLRALVNADLGLKRKEPRLRFRRALLGVAL